MLQARERPCRSLLQPATMLTLGRTTTADPAFRALTDELDAELRARYGAIQDSYDPHNRLGELATAIVARDAATPVGCGCFRRHDETTVEIKRMFVVPAWRGRGVAGQLLDALEGWAREAGFAAAVLETGDRQPDAIALYTRHGYTPVPKFGPYVDLPNSLCMRKAL